MIETDWTQIPRAEKERIAKEAKLVGTAKVAAQYHIKPILVSAWIGCYLRKE